MAYEPLHHKYRPQTFGQLVGQGAIATTLSNALQQQRIAPAYLFCGPRGTGKTSSARILAKSLNCINHPGPHPEPCGTCEICRAIVTGSALDFVEIDAASNTGVDNIRELIERAQFAPVQCRYKVYVIDECHMLSVAAFNALLKTLEEPPERVVFVLATTDPQRVLPTIISRCQRFDYRRIPLEEMVSHLTLIADKEGISIQEAAVRLVAQVSQGGLRDAESLLDQLSLLEPPITAEKVWDLVGAVPERDLLELVRAIAADAGATVLDQARKLMDRGREPLIVLQNLAGFYRDLLIAKTAPNRQDLVAITPPTWAEMCEFAQTLEVGMLLAGQQHLRAAEVQVKNTTQPRLWLEVILMGLLPSTLASPSPASLALGKPTLPSAVSGQTPSGQAPSGQTQATPVLPHSTLAQAGAPVPMAPGEAAPGRGADQNGQGIGFAAIAPGVQAASPVVNPSSSAPGGAQISEPSAAISPPPPENPAPPTAPPLPSDLAQLWQKVVAVLQPLGTRALMQQQGSLLAFNGHTARIGINSQPLYKMAQGRIPNVEEAFQLVLQQKVRVILEVATEGPPPDSPSPASNPAMPSAGGPGEAIAPHPSAPTAIADSPLPGSTAPSPAPMADPLPTGSVVPSSPPAPLPPPSTYPAADLPIEGDFERAVKSFAQFFNGQIVNLEEDAIDGLTQDDRQPQSSPRPDSDVPF